MTTAASTRLTAETVARRSYGKLIAFLAARTRDVAAAEDALSEAFASALATWPLKGCPANPEAWLLTAARRKLIDAARRRRTSDQAIPELTLFAEDAETADLEEIPDQRLALMFACAHPAIDAGVRAPLILQVVLGLDAKAIASAFLVSPAAMGKRLARAKEKIREAAIAFSIPERDALPERLATVLDAIYAAFAEGWSDPVGADLARRDLSEEALFLASLVMQLLPDEPETLGLFALVLHAEARRNARRSSEGDFIPLAQQDPALWNSQMIDTAEALLLRASTMNSIGRFQLEAALQSAHVHRRRSGENNWAAIAQFYDALLALTGSPVVAINRALAVAEIQGASAALDILASLQDDARITDYQPYWAARAELLARTGDTTQARAAYERAIGLERDPAVRRFLQRRAASLPI